MYRRKRWCLALPGLLLAVSEPTICAQELAGSFDQLRVLVRAGDTVRVTDDTGRETRGTIAELSSASLELLVAGNRRQFRESDISTIRQRRSDSLGNGAKWGFGIGAGLGLLGALAYIAEYDDSAAVVPAFALVYGGLGTGIGVGIDAMISSDQVIYSRAKGTGATVTLRPIVTRGRMSVHASLAF